jgi:PAS domain S-box-containing protein/putative nucleotidyltransferase with HDIG domain
MQLPLWILHLEDDPLDAELVHERLQAEGLRCEVVRVDSRAGFTSALEQRPFDLIVADNTMPGFDGLSALAVAREKAPDVPFIFVSGTLGEELAIESLKNGATDYVLKQRLARLGPVARRALQQAEERKRRQQAEAALRQSEERFRALIENSSDVIALIGADANLAYVSPSLTPIFGYAAEEVVGHNAFEFIHPDDQDAMAAKLVEVVKDPGRVLNAVYRIRRRDGAWRWVEATASNLLLEPSVQAVVVNFRDITERKEAEAARRAAETRLAGILDIAVDAIIAVDEDQHLILFNQGAEQIFGYRADEVLGQPLNLLVPPRFHEAHRRHLRRFSAAPEAARRMGERLEIFGRRKDGREFPAEASISKLHQEGTTTFTVILRDITQRKRAEEALRESERQMRALVASLDDIVFEFDEEGTYLNVWARDESLLARPKAEVLGRRIVEVLGEENGRPFTEAVKRVLASGQVEDMEYPLDVTGGRRWFLARISPILSAAGPGRTVSMLVRDITQRKRVEEKQRLSDEILQRVKALVLVADAQGQIVYVSPAAKEILGYEPAELLGERWWELSRSEAADTAREKEYVSRAARGEIPISDEPYERTILARDRQPHTIVWQDAKGPQGLLIGVGHDITEQQRTKADISRRLAELEAVNRISTAMRAAQTLEEMLPRLMDEMLAVLGTDAGAIWLYHAVSLELRLAIARGWFTQLTIAPIKPGEGIAGAVFATGEAYISREFAGDSRIQGAARAQVPAGSGGACVPIRTAHEIVGVLFVSVPLPRTLTPEETRLLTILAEIAGNAIHRTRLHEQTEQRLQRLTALRSIDRAITSSLDLHVTLDIILEQITGQLRVDAADVLLYNRHLHTLEYAAGRGFRGRGVEQSRVRLGEGHAGRAAVERRVVSATNLAASGTEFARAGLLAGEGFVAYYGIPLVAKGLVTGVLDIFSRTPLQPDEEWLGFLEALAGQAAIAVDNATLFNSLQRSNLELSLAYDATIEGWSHALDLRDKETEGHTQRVTEMTLSLARAVGMNEAELVHVRRGALLHDIGKMGIPDGILLKPGPLTEEEWVIMRRHPVYAYEMLSPIAYLRPALDIPYGHHEKWDGTGYPRGLKGEEIPLAARIFAVADVWDALSSDRPYRPAWPEAKVREHIRTLAGSHFDPNMVKVFLRLMATRDRNP